MLNIVKYFYFICCVLMPVGSGVALSRKMLNTYLTLLLFDSGATSSVHWSGWYL